MKKVIEVSNIIWEAMQNADGDTLTEFIHPEAMFVHIGASFLRDDEIKVITEKNCL